MNLKSRKFKIIVKPSSRESKIDGFDNERNAYRASVKAKPEANKANIELIKLFSKSLKKRVRIVSGFKSKEKIMEIIG